MGLSDQSFKWRFKSNIFFTLKIIPILWWSDYKLVAVLTDMDIEFTYKIQFCVVILHSL